MYLVRLGFSFKKEKEVPKSKRGMDVALPFYMPKACQGLGLEGGEIIIIIIIIITLKSKKHATCNMQHNNVATGKLSIHMITVHSMASKPQRADKLKRNGIIYRLLQKLPSTTEVIVRTSAMHLQGTTVISWFHHASTPFLPSHMCDSSLSTYHMQLCSSVHPQCASLFPHFNHLAGLKWHEFDE